MAERNPTAPQVVDPLERQINDTIDRLIGLLNVRRVELLNLVRDKRAADRLPQQMIDQLTETQEQLDKDLRQNMLQPLKKRIMRKLECKKRETILQTPVETLTEVKCDTHELETTISSLGEIVEVPVVSVPRYATFHSSVIATGEKGRDPGELHFPRGVAIHEDTHQIFVANCLNDRVEIFSETGEFLYQLGVGQLPQPWGIATHGDSLYISCWGDSTVSKFSLTEMWRVRRIGGRGSDNGQFIFPHQLTTDPIGRVFIADTGNNRICIHDPDLNHLRNITHESMSRPLDVKVSRDCLYVLCSTNPCMLVLTLEGDKLHSLITRGEGMDVSEPYFFCFDSLNNYVISDSSSHSVRVFSPEGNLLHTIGREGHQPGMFYEPRGVAVTSNRRLVCVSENENYGLQIFC